MLILIKRSELRGEAQLISLPSLKKIACSCATATVKSERFCNTNLTPRKREICGKNEASIGSARNKISSRSSVGQYQFPVPVATYGAATSNIACCRRGALHGSQRHQDLSQIKAGRQLIQFKCRLRHSENGKLPSRFCRSRNRSWSRSRS